MLTAVSRPCCDCPLSMLVYCVLQAPSVCLFVTKTVSLFLSGFCVNTQSVVSVTVGAKFISVSIYTNSPRRFIFT